MAEGRLFSYINDTGTASQIREIDPDTLATINVLAEGLGSGNGVGGIKNRLFWSRTLVSNQIREYDPDTGISLNLVTPPAYIANVGGTLDTLYGWNLTNCLEVDPDTFVILNTDGAHGYINFNHKGGIDGLANGDVYMAWLGANTADMRIVKLDETLTPSTPIRSGGDANHASGVGCINNRVYWIDEGEDEIRELDPATLAIINTVASAGNNNWGIGGVKQDDEDFLRREFFCRGRR